MPDHEFLFEVDLGDGAPLDDMMTALGASILERVGCADGEAADTLAALREAIRRGPCHVRFRAGGGNLDIVVTGAGGREWRTTRALPAAE